MDKKIVLNSSYVIGTQSVLKVIAFFYTIFLARSLGVSNFGLYSVALSFFSLIGSLSDFGITRYLVRELSREREDSEEIFARVVLIKLLLSCALVVGFWAVLRLFDNNATRVDLSTLAVLAVIPQSVAFSFDSVLIARQKLGISAIGVAVANLVNFSIGLLLVTSGYSTTGAIWAVILAQIALAVFLVVMVAKKGFARLKVASLFKGLKESLPEIAWGSLPYGLLGILALIYFKVDSVMLSYMKGDFDTGIYAAAYRFIEAITFVPAAVSSALFPVLARLHDHEPEEVKRLYFRSLAAMGVLGVIVCALYWAILPWLIDWWLPQYVLSIKVVLILALAIPFMFLHLPGNLVLTSSNKFLKGVVVLSFGTLAFNVIANLIFIPIYGFIGAAVVTVLSEILTFGVFFGFVYIKIIKK